MFSYPLASVRCRRSIAVLTSGLLGATALALAAPVQASGVVTTFSYAGATVQTYTVPADVMQQIAVPESGACAGISRDDLNWAGVASGGWALSWAHWRNDGQGGGVCTRTLYYDGDRERWAIRL